MLKPEAFDVIDKKNKEIDDAACRAVQSALSLLNQCIEDGSTYFYKDNGPAYQGGLNIGWIDADGSINLSVGILHKFITKEEYDAIPPYSEIGYDPIDRALESMGLVANRGPSRVWVKKLSPKGKSQTVLVLKPEALSIGH